MNDPRRGGMVDIQFADMVEAVRAEARRMQQEGQATAGAERPKKKSNRSRRSDRGSRGRRRLVR